MDVKASLKQIGFSHGDTEDVKAFQQGYTFAGDLAVDGVAGPKTQAAIQDCINRGGNCGEFFRFVEFRSKGNGRIKVHRQLVRRLDMYRKRAGHAVRIQSGYRDPAHNRAVGGASSSQHLYGTAADVDPDFNEKLARECGFSGLGKVRATGKLAHVDVRAEGGHNTTGARVGAPTVWFYG